MQFPVLNSSILELQNLDRIQMALDLALSIGPPQLCGKSDESDGFEGDMIFIFFLIWA